MKYSYSVKYWLFFGLFLVFMQIVLGGITRLTGSGLSITEWDIVFGTIPPIGETQWLEEFSKYKLTPQYQKINEGMDLSQFKFIYFWEYFHRLWAKMMGFCFLIPFVFFSLTKKIDWYLIKRLLVVIAFAILAAIFGWIMVASGLVNRPWVNAYKLSIHLSIGIAVFVSLWWCILECFYKDRWVGLGIRNSILGKWVFWTFVLVCLQVIFGGWVSGMRAALTYPTWPHMNGSFVPDVLLNSSNWSIENIKNYERSPFASAVVQFLHRTTAYGLIVISYILIRKFVNLEEVSSFIMIIKTIVVFLGVQVILGILTLINSIGSIPITLGVLHQDVGVLLLASFFTLLYAYQKASRENYEPSI